MSWQTTPSRRAEARQVMAGMLEVLRSDGYEEVGDDRENVRAFESPGGIRVEIERKWGEDGYAKFPTVVRDSNGAALTVTTNMDAGWLDEVLP